MQFPKLLMGPVVAFACIFLTTSPAPSQTTSPAPSQTATPSPPVLKKAKERGATPSTATNSKEAPTSGDMTKKQRDFQDCLKNWDKGTHMTKLEWRRTCERTVREYPELR
jgi:hypothetical protein